MSGPWYEDRAPNHEYVMKDIKNSTNYPQLSEKIVHEFIKKCDKNKIPRSEYNIITGYYKKSLNDKSSEFPTDISLAYIDCDLYTSTIDVLKFLVPRLKHGMIIAFDDYFMYSSNSISGNRNAMLEIFNKNFSFHLLPYMQYSHTGFSFIVEDKNINQGS